MKAVLITGCSEGGIGEYLVRSFHKRQYHVFATARTVSKMNTLASLPNITLLKLEVTTPSDIAAAVQAVERSDHTLSFLVNNAGLAPALPLLDCDLDEARTVFEANTWSTLAMCQAFMPLLIKSRGTIVNIATINVYLDIPWMGVYTASKAAQEALMETLRSEVAPLGVRVMTVVTGSVDTPVMSKQAGTFRLPPNSLYKPAEEKIMSRATGTEKVPRMDAAKYAEKVVIDALAGKDGLKWRGGMASTVWWAYSVFPWVISYIQRNDIGMAELRKAFADKSPKKVA